MQLNFWICCVFLLIFLSSSVKFVCELAGLFCLNNVRWQNKAKIHSISIEKDWWQSCLCSRKLFIYRKSFWFFLGFCKFLINFWLKHKKYFLEFVCLFFTRLSIALALFRLFFSWIFCISGGFSYFLQSQNASFSRSPCSPGQWKERTSASAKQEKQFILPMVCLQ